MLLVKFSIEITANACSINVQIIIVPKLDKPNSD